MKKTVAKKQPSSDSTINEKKILVLYNDDEHTFDYVIEALIEICGHEFLQASQCAHITHYKGKCDIKNGSLNEVRPMKNALIDKGLNVTIQ